MKAQFDGWCQVCDDAIRPGDDIRPGEDVADWWCHVDCLTRLEETAQVQAKMASRPRCTFCCDLLQADGRCASCGP